MANEEGQEEKPKIVLKRTCPNCEAKVPTDQTRCSECGENILMAKQKKAAEEFGGDAFTPEKAALNMGVAGGVLLIVIAVVWFYFGWNAAYPPILAVIGIYGIIKGVSEGNVAGKKPGVAPQGRKFKVTPEVVDSMRKLHAAGISNEAIGTELSLSTKTVWRHLNFHLGRYRATLH